MSSAVPLNAGLGCRQTDQSFRHELCAGAFLGRPFLDIPGAGGIDAENGYLGFFQLGNNGREWFAERAAEGEAEDGVNDQVGGLQSGGEIRDKRDGEVLELGPEALNKAN